jgi:tetratricopeptide (TPR) repeat protein
MSATRITARLCAAALVVALAAAAPAEESAAERYFNQRLSKVEKQAAARLWEAAEKARGVSLFRFAREEARRVLELDPDNLKARTFLGYIRRGESWEIDLSQSGKLPTDNRETPTGPRLTDSEPAWRALAAKADLDVAAMFAAFGDECAAKGYRAQAESAYARALAIDPTSATARRGLGHVKLAEGLWIQPDAHRAFEAARTVRPVDGGSRWDDLFGEKFNKAESKHFHVESPHSPERVASYLDSCERAYAAYHADLGLDAFTDAFEKRRVFCVLENDAQWDRWVNRIVSSARQGFYRALQCHLARDRGACAVRNFEGMTAEQRHDRLMHESVHWLNYAHFELPEGVWVDDALAYRYPILLKGTTYAVCLAPRKEDYAKTEPPRDWTNPAGWKALLKDMVAKGDDAALRMIVAKSAFDLPIVASIKAWSVVDYLLARDRAGFVAMCYEMKDSRDFVTLLETRFGKAVETIDDDWRKWVLSTF